MQTHIQIKFFVGLNDQTPPSSDHYPIESGITVECLLDILQISTNQKLIIFINNKRAALTSCLKGGERVAVLPPVGGG